MSFDLYMDIPKGLANFNAFSIHLKMQEFLDIRKKMSKKKKKKNFANRESSTLFRLQH